MAAQSEPCVCHEGLGAFERCQSGHPDGWLDNRGAEQSAHNVIAQARLSGIAIDPDSYPRDVATALRGMMLNERYDRNRDAGRAIHDDGDENGNPTILPPLKRDWRKRSLTTPGEREAPALLADIASLDQAMRAARGSR